MSLLQPLARLARSTCRPLTRRLFSSAPRTVPRSPYRTLLLGAVAGSVAYAAFAPTTIHLDTEAKTTQVQEDPDTVTDPATSIAFPKTIQVQSKAKYPPLSLVGLGVRTVSFLGIKVYSVGFYADLSNPSLKIPKDMPPEEKVEYIVRNTACVVRIVPTRSTSYTHLRDAFMRALQARQALGVKSGTLTEEVAQEASSPMRKLKSLFPNSPLAKHTPLDIFLAPPIPGRSRALVFRDLGAIENDWVATEFVLHYFEGEGPSPPLKKSVLEHLESVSK
ncbi:chalcone-flavanone isomerase-domain-containing protein [Crucibulum laeve]|uniref:Chalcone-flavanone isomerase-domain-containing protein n=1 Tax=Crucibulum laeve TaxID=68775 RepID=A0A5C3MJF5_9AGAR|nr:chalcone-flavanone isomerase-domain-containing protein [Crucibulum laeve]